MGVLIENVVCVGNDLNNVDCLKSVGCGIVPADANELVKPFVNIF